MNEQWLVRTSHLFTPLAPLLRLLLCSLLRTSSSPFPFSVPRRWVFSPLFCPPASASCWWLLPFPLQLLLVGLIFFQVSSLVSLLHRFSLSILFVFGLLLLVDVILLNIVDVLNDFCGLLLLVAEKRRFWEKNNLYRSVIRMWLFF